MKKILICIMAVLLLSLSSYANTTFNGDGTDVSNSSVKQKGYSWLGVDGARISVYSKSTKRQIGESFDIYKSTVNTDSVELHFGCHNKIYLSNMANIELIPVSSGDYARSNAYENPSKGIAFPNIMNRNGATGNRMTTVKEYFTKYDVIQAVLDNVGLTATQWNSNEYSILVEAIGIFTLNINGYVFTAPATSAELGKLASLGIIESDYLTTTGFQNLPFCLYLTSDQLGIKAYNGSKSSLQTKAGYEQMIKNLGCCFIDYSGKITEGSNSPGGSSSNSPGGSSNNPNGDDESGGSSSGNSGGDSDSGFGENVFGERFYNVGTTVITSVICKDTRGLGFPKQAEHNSDSEDDITGAFHSGVDTEAKAGASGGGNANIVFSYNGTSKNYSLCVPPGEEAYAWIKWKVPSSPCEIDMVVTAPEGISLSENHIKCYIIKKDSNTPPDTSPYDTNDTFDYDQEIVVLSENTSQREHHWTTYTSHWEENLQEAVVGRTSMVIEGELVVEDIMGEVDLGEVVWESEEHFAKLLVDSDTFELKGSEHNPTFKQSNGLPTTKSGYGITLDSSFYTQESENASDMIVKPQSAWAYFPEYGWSDYARKLTMKTTGVNTSIKFPINTNSQYNDRVHYIPLWWKDDKAYMVKILVEDFFTPVGEIEFEEEMEVNVQGSMYDDWHIKSE